MNFCARARFRPFIAVARSFNLPVEMPGENSLGLQLRALCRACGRWRRPRSELFSQSCSTLHLTNTQQARWSVKPPLRSTVVSLFNFFPARNRVTICGHIQLPIPVAGFVWRQACSSGPITGRGERRGRPRCWEFSELQHPSSSLNTRSTW